MAGTIVVDRLESDASYASSINVASPMVVSNTITMGSAAAITGNVNIDNGTLFVNQNNNRVGVGGITNPSNWLDVNNSISITENGVASSNTSLELYSRFSDNQRGYVILKAESNSSGSSDLVVRSRNNFSEAERFRIDSVGRITTPFQPSFLAQAVESDTTYSGSGTLIPFPNEVFDVGNNYNTSTSRFTAPVTGVYMVSWTCWHADSGNGGRSALYKNGTAYKSSTNTNPISTRHDAGKNQPDGVSIPVQLSSGDYIEVKVFENNVRQFWMNYFSAYLIG
jgi:hypothetical protein